MAARVFGRDGRLARLGLVSDVSESKSRLRRRLGLRDQTRFQMEQVGFVVGHGLRSNCGGLSNSLLRDSPLDCDKPAGRGRRWEQRHVERENSEHELRGVRAQYPVGFEEATRRPAGAGKLRHQRGGRAIRPHEAFAGENHRGDRPNQVQNATRERKGKAMKQILRALTLGSLLWAPLAHSVERKPAPKNVSPRRISLYEVPLVCPAAPEIGCGSRSKPVLLALEQQPAVAEAWLNRAGTVMAVVWKAEAKRKDRTSA